MTLLAPALFTIDEPHSRDLDDAIGVARTENGWLVRVAIANPSAAVAIGSTDDVRARARGATVYRGNAASVPMLPRSISQEQSTLTAGEERAAMLIDLNIDRSGTVNGTRIAFELVRIARRLTYKDIPAIASSGQPRPPFTSASVTDEVDELQAPVNDAITISKLLLQQRRARGALAVFDPGRMLLTDEEGRLQFFDVSEMDGHLLVQEIMIAANAAVAAFAASNNIPFLFRSHEPRISSPRGLAAAESFEAWLAGGRATAAAAAERLSLVAQKARYSNILTGHYALSLPAYSHVTSPLRRYADLVVQRQLAAFLDGSNLPYTQEQLGVIGDELYTIAHEKSESAADFFKSPVIAKAQSALEGNYALKALADNELGQAVKLALVTGFAQALVDELVRRMSHDCLADKVALRLLEGRSFLPSDLAQAFVAMLAGKPARAVSLVHAAISIGEIETLEIRFTEASGSFVATASMRDISGGRTLIATAADIRKKDAEQAAVLLAVCELMDVAAPAPIALAKAVPAAPTNPATKPAQPAPADGNPKGALLEFCQKRRLPTPTFSTTFSGPSNAPTFVCECVLTISGKNEFAHSPTAATKKQAEALASAAMLKVIAHRRDD